MTGLVMPTPKKGKESTDTELEKPDAEDCSPSGWKKVSRRVLLGSDLSPALFNTCSKHVG